MADRHRRVPNANSPDLLFRLIALVARGVRSTRGLQEGLGVEPRTVQYYTQAAEWLGFLDEEGLLTVAGLEWAYRAKDREEVYARTLWSQPHVSALLGAPPGQLPSLERVREAVERSGDDLSPATLARRVSAVRGLLGPAVRARMASADRQLLLPLPVVSDPGSSVGLPAQPDEYDPEVYRFVLGELLDYGELTLGHLRALLDRAGATQGAIGGQVDLALARGDARRVGDRLVITPGAVARRELVQGTWAILFSDPGYRRHLAAVASTGRAEPPRRAGPNYTAWDQRLFGHAAQADRLSEDLARVLFDRPLSAFQVAGDAGPDWASPGAPFLDLWDQAGLLITLPPYLAGLSGGVEALNRRLRPGPRNDVHPPDLAERPLQAHGGLLHPGEPPLLRVPDSRSLRLRLVLQSPYVALTVALLLVHRRNPEWVELTASRRVWRLRRGRRDLGEVLERLDGFAASRGWVASRRKAGGLSADSLVGLLESVGLARRAGPLAVLDDRFFSALRESVEEQEVAARLEPLAEALAAWLREQEPA